MRNIFKIFLKKIFKVSFSSAACVLFFLLSASQMMHTAQAAQKISAGTFIKAAPLAEINSAIADKGDSAAFINLYDMYIYETNVLPANTIFYAVIDEVREPVPGRNASIKMSVSKMVLPDNRVYKIKGRVCSASGKDYTGGETAQAAYYRKVYHHSYRLRPFLQIAPLNISGQGRHVIIRPGSEYFILLEDDIILE